MNDFVRAKLENLREDYDTIQGHPFSHFYCPILFTDEDVPLCQAHIVNKAFEDVSRTCTVQRTDVDSFYGSRFESDFVDIDKFDDADPFKILMDRSASERFNAKVIVDGKEVDHFFSKARIPHHFTQVNLVGLHSDIPFGLKMRPDELRKLEGKQLEVEVKRDIRLSMLVSVIKSAHLTLFEMLGYRYVFSAAGYFIGRQILGEFYLRNFQNPKSDVQKHAIDFFRQYVHMARPLISSDLGYQGTISDRQLLMCVGSSGKAWAQIVFIRSSNKVHSVMVPAFDDPERVETYMNFLKNDNEWLHVANCKFEGDKWAVSKEAKPLRWPKQGTLYPDNP